ncbi:MAG: cytidylate kinase-like family protein [Lachnospiraceae bacterium]|nr:MAG: cytidylate kinase-like family protein [Lachnospiraceae bacterium]
MSKKYIITLSREFGSLGRPIARKLSEFLGIDYYDREIVEKTAENLGLPLEVIKNTEEKVQSRFFAMGFPLGTGATDQQDQIFSEQARIIRDMTDKGSCIIVGRCSDYILGNEKNCYRIYVYSPLEDRYRNCVDYLHIDPNEARKMIAKVDKARKAYHLHYAGYLPGDEAGHDLMINSSVMGVDGTARCLEKVIRVRFGLEDGTRS